MKKVHIEILLASLGVTLPTYFIYRALSGYSAFWNAQKFWSLALIACWAIVAYGYYNQGSLVHEAKSASHVSIILPITVFFVQCILFVKGIYYRDYALVGGAVLVNSGVLFSLYQIWRFKRTIK